MTQPNQPVSAPQGAPLWNPNDVHGRVYSPSQISTYLSCGAAWFYKYILRLPEPSTARQALGKALHTTFAGVLAASGLYDDPPIADAQDALTYQLERELDAATLDEGDDPAKIQDTARAVLNLWFSENLWRISAAMFVEVPVSGYLDGLPMRGVVDVIHEDGSLTDWKIASKRPGSISAAQQLQLATYCELTRARSARIVTLTTTKTPAATVLSYDHTPDMGKLARTTAAETARAISAGIAIPNRSSLWCSRKNCPFADQCVSDYGGFVS